MESEWPFGLPHSIFPLKIEKQKRLQSLFLMYGDWGKPNDRAPQLFI